MNINLRGVYEVHLKQTGLQMSLGGPVVLQSVQQEGGALLDQVALHEHVYDLRGMKDQRAKRVMDVTEFESLPSVDQQAE